MCDIWKRTDRSQTNVADLQRHRESMRVLGVRQVVLTGGEPLLHNDIQGLCNFFRELGIRITLLTTGLLLSKHAEIVATHFDDVIVSLDGPAEVHNRVRQIRTAFTLIQQGIAAVREYNPTLRISCRTTVQKANHVQLRATVDAAKLLTLDSISFLPADLSSQAFNRAQPWNSDRKNEIALSHEELIGLEGEIELLISANAEDIDRGYIVEDAAKLRRLANRFREHLGYSTPKAPSCNAPWISAVIDVNGSVRPCFFHPVVGSIKYSTLEDAINSESALSFRSSLSVQDNPICTRCVCSLNYRQDRS
jgi:MoaA/NifB/PqqE/SkfB family radical SAM enzyme